MTRVAIYAGTFDPPTLGHHSVIMRAARLVDRLIVVIAINPLKSPLFSLETRLEMLCELVRASSPHSELRPTIEITSTQELVIDLARHIDAEQVWLVRGARTPEDFLDEVRLADLNRQFCPGLETLILPAPPALSEVSSTRVRELLTRTNQQTQANINLAIGLPEGLTDATSPDTLSLHQLCHPSTLRLIEAHSSSLARRASPEPPQRHGP